MEGERLLTVAQAAELLQASQQTIRNWIKRGRIRASLPAGDSFGYRIRASEIERFIVEAEVQVGPAGERKAAERAG